MKRADLPEYPTWSQVRKCFAMRRSLSPRALEKLRACDDVVHGWDDPADFSMWKKVFAEALAP